MSSPRLPRRAALGIVTAPAEAGGVLVRAVLADGAAAGLLVSGDRVIALAGAAIADVAALTAALRGRPAGEVVTVRAVRDGVTREIDVALKDMPLETCPEGLVEYGEISARGWRLRTIVTRPRGAEKVPGWLWIPGIACASQDFAAAPNHPARPLIAALAAAGAATMRIELPGLGDSEGPECARLGFTAQVEVFAAGLRALRAMPWLEPGAVGLFGHSLGGTIAALLADEAEVRGVAVYGASARPWSSVVQQAIARAGLGEPPAEVAVGGRSPEFHAELAQVDIAGAWSRVAAEVLVMHGERDAVVEGADARGLVELLSRRTCAKVQHVEAAGGEHGLAPAIAGPLLAWARERGLAGE